jgi:hypothetical protein
VKVLFLLGHVVPHVLVLEAAVALLCELVALSHDTRDTTRHTRHDTTHTTRHDTHDTTRETDARVKKMLPCPDMRAEMKRGYLDLVLGHVGEVDVAADVLPQRDVGQYGV